MPHLRPPPSPPPEPPEPPSVYCTPSPQSKATTPSPKARSSFMSRQQSSVKPSPIITKVTESRQATPQSQQASLTLEFPYENMITSKAHDRVLLRRHRHTNPAVWCCAIICLIFSLLVIFFGIATLIIFFVVKPRTPVLDTNRANLTVIYFDTPGNFNGDFTFIANFSNPNRKLDVKFEHAVMELLFENNLIATQSIRPFSQRPKETGVVAINFISSLVSLPPNNAMELRKQVLSNKVMYSVRGTFKVRASFGAIHFSYWLHGNCDLQMSSPPAGYLMARTCKTKR